MYDSIYYRGETLLCRLQHPHSKMSSHLLQALPFCKSCIHKDNLKWQATFHRNILATQNELQSQVHYLSRHTKYPK